MPVGSLWFTPRPVTFRPITVSPVTLPSEQVETRFAALTSLQIRVLECCAGLKEFLPRAITYLSQPGNDKHSDDVAHFLMGSLVDLPHGLDKPHPEISHPTTKCLEVLLRTERPRIGGNVPLPASTINILRGIVAIQQPAAKPSGASALDRVEDRTVSRGLQPIPVTSPSKACKTQFKTLTRQHMEALVGCTGLTEFMSRAITYLSQPGHDKHSDEVADFLMGRAVDLPPGLEEPHAELSQSTKESLAVLLDTQRPKIHGKVPLPADTIDMLRFTEAALQRVSKRLRAWASNLAADRTLTHSLEPIPGTFRTMACPSAQFEDRALTHSLETIPGTFRSMACPSAQFATQLATLTSWHDIEALVHDAGLKEFLPRAINYLLQPGHHGHSEEVAGFLMGDTDGLPDGLARPSPEISPPATECLERLLDTGRSRTGKKALQPEPVIDTLGAIEAVQLRAATQLRAWALDVAEELPVSHPVTLEELPVSRPVTLEEQFEALSIEHIAALVYGAELTEFLPHAITYLSQPGNDEHSKAVDQFLTGRQDKLPAGLDKPHRQISDLAAEGLKVLLETNRPKMPKKGAVPESTLNILRYLVGKQLGIQSGASTSNVAEDLPVSRRVDSSPDTSAFEQRFEALSEKQKAMLMDCAGLREFLPTATEFLNKPGNRKHARVVAHYLMGKEKTLPTGLHGPEEPIPDDVKVVLRDLLRTSAHPLSVWNNEARRKTLRKLDALALHLMLDSLHEGGAPPASGKASVTGLESFDTDDE